MPFEFIHIPANGQGAAKEELSQPPSCLAGRYLPTNPPQARRYCNDVSRIPLCLPSHKPHP
jgi:hypothetical protein